jgi:phosphate/sulfate permease
MVDSFAFVVFLILVALAFDYINGFHDAANSIATIVSTRVLTPNRRSPGRPSSILPQYS